MSDLSVEDKPSVLLTGELSRVLGNVLFIEFTNVVHASLPQVFLFTVFPGASANPRQFTFCRVWPIWFHTTNASWAAVQELESSGLLSKEVILVTKEIPVSYSSVKDIIPRLWQQYNPKLCVHVGVSGCTNIVQMESCGHNLGYERPDVDGQLHEMGCCVPGGPDCLHTSLDLGKVCSDAKAQGWEISISEDAGRYLCEFIYYTSLHLNLGPVVFIHVPPLDQPYSKAKLAAALKIIIMALLKQIQ